MKKRIFALLLLLTLLVSSSLPTTAFAAKATNQSNTTKDDEHGTTSFSDITYKKPDYAAIEKKIDTVASLLKKKNQDKKIEKLLEEINTGLLEAQTMATYLRILYSKNVTDTDTINELNDITAKNTTLTGKIANLLVQLFESSYAELAKEDLTEEDIKSIYDLNKSLTPEYVNLTTESTNLYTQYVTTINSTIDVNGTAMTLNEIATSTTLTQEEITQYASKLYQQMNEDAGNIYLELVDVYKQQAKINGYDSVIDWKYAQYGRKYKAIEVEWFASYVKETIVPLYYDLYNSFTEEEVALLQSAPSAMNELQPYFTEYFSSINKEMLEAYDYLVKYDLCDFDISAQKEQTSYTTYLYSLNQPYIQQYGTGSYIDVSTFVHEFGHFYSYYKHGADLSSHLDILEIHSQANELLFSPYYSIYGDAYEPILKNQVLIMLGNIINGCLQDEFQQYVYSHEVTSVEELNEIYFDLECEYGLVDPNSGYTQDMSWIFIHHTFNLPFYYLSYATSAVPSLEIFCQSLTDREGAIKTYNKFMHYGTDYNFVSTLLRSRLGSPFDENTINGIADTLRDAFGLNVETTSEVPAA